MDSQMTNPSRRRYVGDEPPKVKHITNEQPLSYRTEHEAKIDDGDYLPSDDQGWDEFKEEE